MIRSSHRLWLRASAPCLVVGMTLLVDWAGLVRCWADAGKSKRPSTGPSAPASVAKPAVGSEAIASPEMAGVRQITFDDLKLDLKKNKGYDSSLLTARVKQLEGKSVCIRGFLYPTHQQSEITQFVLMYDDCPPVDHCIVVEMAPPSTIDFVVHAIDVEGVFSIRELKGPDGKVHAIYHMEGKKVRPVPGILAPPSRCGC
jgi:hypothetical protein